jgi:hypothetical protein
VGVHPLSRPATQFAHAGGRPRGVSFLGFALLPVVLGPLGRLASSHELLPYVVLTLLIPSLTYLLLSWVWLIARVLHDLFGGTPRGGHPHPVGSES